MSARLAVPLALGLLAAAAVAVAVAVLVARGGEDPYRVRAIFDNAGFVIAGEDVKVAGVRVGRVDAVELTPELKAAVVLRIEDPGYQDFRADARCVVRPQSLIGERFVECTPTRARGAGAEAPGPLRRIEDGPGAGQRLLPEGNTSRAVDLDLVQNIMREPERERLSIILSELGAGLAGRGEDLDAVIRKADPALGELDAVLAILARQNARLAQLAVDSDAIMRPLARERRRVSSAITNISDVAEATASRRADLEASLARLPRFLRELRPTMTRLDALAGQMTPVLADLGDAAPDVNRLVGELGPFSAAATPALESLGDVAGTGIPALRTSLPVVRDTGRLAAAARPVGRRLAATLVSFRRTGGIERLMDWLFYQAAAVNGFDAYGHYLRAGLLVNQCSSYAAAPVTGCSANFRRASASSATATAPVAAPRAASAAAAAPAPRGAAVAPRAAAPVPGPLAPADPTPLLDYLFGSER